MLQKQTRDVNERLTEQKKSRTLMSSAYIFSEGGKMLLITSAGSDGNDDGRDKELEDE